MADNENYFSNPYLPFSTEENSKNNGLTTQFNADQIDELFETLSWWHDYLEKDVPGFGQPEEPQP